MTTQFSSNWKDLLKRQKIEKKPLLRPIHSKKTNASSKITKSRKKTKVQINSSSISIPNHSVKRTGESQEEAIDNSEIELENENEIQNRVLKKMKLDEKTPKRTASIKVKDAKGEYSPALLALWAEEQNISLDDVKKSYGLKPSLPSQDLSLELPSYTGRKKETGKFISMDCEFVGIGSDGKTSALARVSIVNFYGYTILDTFVKPKEHVTDWRTWVSGVTAAHMKDAISFQDAQKQVADLMKNRILIGHSIQNDLKVLMLSHPRYAIRDTSMHPSFKALVTKGKKPSLKFLTKEVLHLDIQGSEHSSVEDARATMLLYRTHKKEFEDLAMAKSRSRGKLSRK